MNNTFKEKIPQTDAIWGFPSRFDIRDMPRGQQSVIPIEDLSQVVATSICQPIESRWRGIDLIYDIEKSAVVFDLELYVVGPDGDVLVKSWAALGIASGQVHAGNAENINLEGQSFKVRVVNPQNGWVTVKLRAQY